MQKKNTRHLRVKKTFREAIGKKVYELREAKKLTTTELGAMAGVSQAQISRLENGLQGFRSDTLLDIALALGVHPSALVSDWKG